MKVSLRLERTLTSVTSSVALTPPARGFIAFCCTHSLPPLPFLLPSIPGVALLQDQQ
jgi:hypothetical protein